MEDSAQLLEDSLLVIWNDRDPARRLQAMENVYATDIAFYEASDGPAIVGYEAINNVISYVQQQWPLEFAFELSNPGRANHGIQHIAWTLGVHGQSPVATGMDIAIIENGKIKSLHLFLNAAHS